MHREDAHFADSLLRAIVLAVLHEPALEPLGGHITRDRSGVPTYTSTRYSLVVEVGGKDLHLSRAVVADHNLPDKDGDRERFLPGSTARYPDTNSLFGCRLRDQLRYDALFEHFVGGRIAKELRYIDKELVKEQPLLAAVTLQQLQVLGCGLYLQQLHAALNTTNERLLLVLCEVMPEPTPQQSRNLRQLAEDIIARSVLSLERLDVVEMLLVLDELAGHLFDGNNQVHETRRRCAVWHTLRRRRVSQRLCEGKTAMLFHNLQAERAVQAGTGKDDPGGKFSKLLRERKKQSVYGPSLLTGRCGLCHAQCPVFDGQCRIRRDHKDAVRCDRSSIRGFFDAHPRMGAQELHEQALVLGREVLDNDERHAGVRPHICKKSLERVQTTSGSAKTHHHVVRLAHRMTSLLDESVYLRSM